MPPVLVYGRRDRFYRPRYAYFKYPEMYSPLFVYSRARTMRSALMSTGWFRIRYRPFQADLGVVFGP